MFSTKQFKRLVPFSDDVGRPRPMLSGFIELFSYVSQGCRKASNPRAEISERLRRNSKSAYLPGASFEFAEFFDARFFESLFLDYSRAIV
jgi:hypothetical protein